ncbi:MAG: hypothetical protein JWP91_1502 [Fibrobacteres bacterium]|nr:hypothetical protein [Fibrobacterota bacterium]
MNDLIQRGRASSRILALGACLGMAMALSFNGCESAGGTTGGSETTNGLTGIIRDRDGNPVARTQVALVPFDYVPVRGQDARALKRSVTDAQGRYRFAGVASGVYNLEAKDPLRQVQALVRGIHIDSGSAYGEADGTLRAPGTLEIPFSDRHLPENAQAYLAGTTYSAFIASKAMHGTVILGNIAAGEYPELLALSPDLPEGGPAQVTGAFRIGGDSVTRLGPLQSWLHSAALKWDPSAIDLGGGQAGSGSITDYPLLVRLSASDFDFSQARSGGEDVRFTRKDGTLLAHQIEHWDSAAGSAAVWVRVDSLPAIASDSALILHWGRNDAVDASHGDLVFGPPGGFASVWHLGEAANTATGGYRDALGVNHATAAGPNADSRLGAVAGSGKRFSPTAGPLAAALPMGLGGNGSFSVTFWMRFEAAPGRAGVLTFGEPVTDRGMHFLIRADSTAQFGPWGVSPDSLDSPSAQQNHFSLAPYAGKWAHVATVYDASKGRLATYIDGTLAAANDLPALDINGAFGLDIGNRVNMITLPQSDFRGDLDEVRIYARALTEPWIKMEYATQKEGSAVLTRP